MEEKKRPVSPVNGQPLPVGNKWKTSEEAREAGRKGGKRSVEVRRQRKTLREDLLTVLTNMSIPQKDGKETPVQEALAISLIKQVLNGNVRAYEVIRDTIGEKPVENISIATADFKALDEAFKKEG